MCKLLRPVALLVFLVSMERPLLFGQEMRAADTSEVEALKARVVELEKQVEELRAAFTKSLAAQAQTTTVADTATAGLEKEIAAALAQEAPSLAPAVPSVQPRVGLQMNPNIGVLGNFLASRRMGNALPEDGFQFDEAELSFRMVIDPYARADFFIAVSPLEETVELEEGYITYLALPAKLQARAGFFRPRFGKLNLTHRPETPFIDYPLVLTHYLGPDGLAEPGLELSYLVPNPWGQFVELTVSVLNGNNEVSFNGAASHSVGDLLYLAHLKSFFDFTENSTLELGLSGMTGVNDPKGMHRTNIAGLDLTYRWRPLRYKQYKAIALQTEFLFSHREESDGRPVTSWGFFSYLEWRFRQRWFLATRVDYSQFPQTRHQNERAYSTILTFWPSEFQTLRLQYKHTDQNFGDSDNQIFAQWFFVIGAHGAHPY